MPLSAAPASAAGPPPKTQTVYSATNLYRVDLAVDVEHGESFTVATAQATCRNSSGLLASCQALTIRRHRSYPKGVVIGEEPNIEGTVAS